MVEPESRKASPRWSAVVDHLNDVQRHRQDAARPATAIADALRADPVGAFLGNLWVNWARWQDPIKDPNRIAALLDIANGKPNDAPNALDLATTATIEREPWRSRLERIAAADNNEARKALRGAMAPELIREIRDNAAFVVDHRSISELRFHMLDRRGSVASLSYATLLLLDPTGPGRTLCTCRLPGCGVFYFASVAAGPGRKKTSYCPAHTEEGQKAVNRKAQRKWRKNHPRKKPTTPQRSARNTQEP